MNERIRQLVRQAGLDDADFPIENWDNVPLAKFAELIVQECATVIERNLFQGIGWNTSRAVRQHFGINNDD